MNKFLIVIFLISYFNINAVLSQPQKSIEARQQFWVAYMTNAPINEKYSLWNDFHFVPKGFWVARTGLTRHFNQASFTTGFAYLGLPVVANQNSLQRNEYRPWAQLTWSTTSVTHLSFNTRIRYDARFRQKVVNGELLDDYPFLNRIRLAVTSRYKLNPQSSHVQYFAQVGSELLLNFGKDVTFNTFDQFRINGTIGFVLGDITFQTGYMYRFVQTGSYNYVGNHTILCWLSHQINWLKTSKSKNQ